MVKKESKKVGKNIKYYFKKFSNSNKEVTKIFQKHNTVKVVVFAMDKVLVCYGQSFNFCCYSKILDLHENICEGCFKVFGLPHS